MANAFEQAVRDQLDKREVRGRSPAFQAEMAREKREFSVILSKLGDNAFETGVTTFVKTPLALLGNGLKTAYDKKYGAQKWGKDAFKLLLGKEGITHKTLKLIANILHLAGKGTKIGIRELFKI